MNPDRPRRVLVIDDEPGFCEMMQDLLGREGYVVDHALHPIVAAEQAMSGDYDLVTLDLNLREFDGKEVWDLYRKVGLVTPVVVISGYLTAEVEAVLRDAGVAHFVQKPFRSARLLSAIEDALRERAA